MTTPNVIITNAGLQALINAEQTGTDAVKLSKVIYSSEAINASTASVLSDIDPDDIVATLTSVSGTITGEHTIHISAGDASDNAYTVKTIGIVTDDDVLFAVISSDSGLISKIATTQAYVSFDMELTQGNPAYIEFGDTNFLNPDASVSVKGIAMLATSAEAIDGVNETKIITPKTLLDFINNNSSFIFPTGARYIYNQTTDYLPGDMKFYNENIYICHAENGPNTTAGVKLPSDEEYWYRIPTVKDFEQYGFSTGDIKPLMSNNIPETWLLANGAVVSRADNPKLVEYAYDNDLVRDATEQTQYETNSATFAGRIYGPGDGSSTIQIPDLRGRSLMGATSASTMGRYQPEQLPNITGNILDVLVWANHSANGAFSDVGGWLALGSTGGSSMGATRFSFDASRSSAIYTNLGKVYPLSLSLNYIIKS